MKIAAAKYVIQAPRDFEAFATRQGALLGEAARAGAQLAVLPEYLSLELAAGQPPEQRLDLAASMAALQPLEPAWHKLFAGLARELGMSIQAGTFLTATGEGRFRNRAWWYAPDGRRVFQDKLQLTGFEKQLGIIEGGDALKVFEAAPGVRAGFMMGDAATLAKIGKVAEDTYISPGYFAHGVTAAWCAEGKLGPQIERLKKLYAPRLDATLAAIDKHMPDAVATRPDGGFFLSLTLPEGIATTAVLVVTNTVISTMRRSLVPAARRFEAGRTGSPAARLFHTEGAEWTSMSTRRRRSFARMASPSHRGRLRPPARRSNVSPTSLEAPLSSRHRCTPADAGKPAA